MSIPTFLAIYTLKSTQHFLEIQHFLCKNGWTPRFGWWFPALSILFPSFSKHFSAVQVAVGDDVIEIRGFRLTRLHHGAGLVEKAWPEFSRQPTLQNWDFKLVISVIYGSTDHLWVIIFSIFWTLLLEDNIFRFYLGNYLIKPDLLRVNRSTFRPALLSHLVRASGFRVMAVFKSTVTWRFGTGPGGRYPWIHDSPNSTLVHVMNNDCWVSLNFSFMIFGIQQKRRDF